MIRSELVLVGGGGHASVIREAAIASGWRLAGYYDDRSRLLRKGKSPLKRLGGFRDFLNVPDDERALILAVGCLETRRELIELHRGEFAKVVHPNAVVSETSLVSPGTFVAAAAIVNPYSEIARHVIVNTRAIVEHHCQVEENCHLAPGAILGGGVYVGADTLIGISASVNPNVHIGKNCVVGAGAVVTDDVADGSVMVGVPARPLQQPLRKSA